MDRVQSPLRIPAFLTSGTRGAELTAGRHVPGAAVALIALTAGANLLYLAVRCPLDLAPDEAHYWHWSRHLALSYYSKGPLVAWVIRASCELLGGLSTALVGTEMLAVRLPAVAFNALMLTAIYKLSVQTFGRPVLALGAVAAAATLPAANTTGTVMTIDSPFLCCWAWACVLGQRAVFGGTTRTWLAAGAVVAVGVLAKYTMLMFPACVGLYLLASPSARPHLARPGFWLFCAASTLGMLPVVVWNAAHEWVTFRHVSVQAGVTTEARGPNLLGPLVFVGCQFGLLLGYWLAAWAGGVWAFRPTATPNPRAAFLWWLSVPVFAFFALVSVRTNVQLNWPAPAYVAGLVLATAWVADRLASPSPRMRRVAAGCLAVAVALGVGFTVAVRYPGTIRPVLVMFAPEATPYDRTPIRKVDPTGRLSGWQDLGEAVGRVRDRVTAEDGADPVIAGMNWMVPGEVSFYCPGHPEVYSVGLAVCDRHSQYDLWRPNPLADAQLFRGRTFVYVGELAPSMWDVFDAVEPPIDVITRDQGIPVSAWRIWVCRGYRGFPRTDGQTDMPGY